jgi:hypothetical protein
MRGCGIGRLDIMLRRRCCEEMNEAKQEITKDSEKTVNQKQRFIRRN